MVWSRESDVETPSLSLILPGLYLGAESDVTQDCLSSLGIGFVLSVSRSSPQPSFLPPSRFLRVSIDDSLWDDLLPWIPQALRFIDAALSCGDCVLVHCAAGISRSPAVAVAYIMYSLGLDLDHAYRFVKERRPSISPNFNFLGQLQHFQATLNLQQPDAVSNGNRDITAGHVTNHDSAELPLTQHSAPDPHRVSHSDEKPLHLTLHQIQDQVQTPPKKLPECTASLSEKRKSLTLVLTPPCPPPSVRRAPPKVSAASRSGEAKGHADSAHRKEAGLLSPFSVTLNKLLGWGERLLLGGVFLPPVRMGQPALPYRC